MAYDEELADRIRAQLADEFDVVEKRIFSSLGFMVHGHLAVAATKDGLLARTDPELEERTLALPGVSRMSSDPRRPMRGWVVIDTEHVADDADLERWMATSLDLVAGLPPKA